jgi:hypothetical protein
VNPGAGSPDDAVPAPLADAIARLEARASRTVRVVPVAGTGRAADTAAGRRAAAAALHAVHSTHPVVDTHHADGRPCWPADATGSIAHADGLAVAVADRVGCVVGIDLERSGALPAADAAVVLARHEQALVDAHEAPDHEATRVWAAKEAAFKAWCEATDGGLGTVDPIDLLVDLGPDDRGLRPVVVHATGALAAPTASIGPLTGWCADTGDHVVVLVSSERAANRGAHHGVDGIASAPTTNPSAANAST